MDYLEYILPARYQDSWDNLQPSVCSTMRKDFVITDDFIAATYKSGYFTSNYKIHTQFRLIHSGFISIQGFLGLQ